MTNCLRARLLLFIASVAVIAIGVPLSARAEDDGFEDMSAAAPPPIESAISYGDLMIEDAPHDLVGPNLLGLSASYDVTNPYLDILGAGLSYSREAGPIFSFGGEGTAYIATDNHYNRSVENDLRPYGVSADHDRPIGAAFAIARAKLVQGRINVLGSKALPVRLQARVGAGSLFFTERTSMAATWGVDLETFVSPEWGAALRFIQDIERPASSNSIHRERVAMALIRAF